ncbi:MAG: sigma 54-interacting transcriptional regulator [Polyangiaceae bacterium]
MLLPSDAGSAELNFDAAHPLVAECPPPSLRVMPDVDRTLTQSTGKTDEPDLDRSASYLLTLMLECDQPNAPAEVINLDNVDSVRVGRGDVRSIKPGKQPRSLEIAVPDRRISGTHAVFERVDGTFRVRDLGSANGTRVGGARVESAMLEHGDVVQLGHSVFAFEHKVLRERVPYTAGTTSPIRTLSVPYAARLAQLARIAMTQIPVLFLGESGTGKEVLARVTHELSGRPGAFMAVNCGAIPPNLVESHLFGHVKGSFTGAVRDELGFVRSADGGTLFLDEIGDLPPSSQAALLRVLQEGEVHPVGAARGVKVDVRVIAATHRSLSRMQDEGTFRRDLYARLSGFVVELPALRERREDIGHLIGELLTRAGKSPGIRPEAAIALLRHDWPLNIRELNQVLTAAAALAQGGVIQLEHLPTTIAQLTGRVSVAATEPAASPSSEPPSISSLSPADQALRAELVTRLTNNNGNLSAVAREMGKARQQIQRWVRRFHLKGG